MSTLRAHPTVSRLRIAASQLCRRQSGVTAATLGVDLRRHGF